MHFSRQTATTHSILSQKVASGLCSLRQVRDYGGPGWFDDRKFFRSGRVKKEAAEPQRAGGFLTTLKCRRDQDRQRPQTGVSSERNRCGLVNAQTSPRARAKVKKAPYCVFSVTM